MALSKRPFENKVTKAMLTSVVSPPIRRGKGIMPLWLRLEYNHIKEPEALLIDAEAALCEARLPFCQSNIAKDKLICHVSNFHSGACTPDTCVVLRTTGKCPFIRVTYMSKQKSCDFMQVAPMPVAEAQYWRLS